jgi:hypothetical protein
VKSFTHAADLASRGRPIIPRRSRSASTAISSAGRSNLPVITRRPDQSTFCDTPGLSRPTMLLHRHDLPVRHRDDDVRSPARLRSLLTQLEDSPIAAPWYQARRSSNAKIVRQVPETFERRTRLGWALSTRSVPPPEPARRLTTPHHFVGDQLDERLHLSVGERVHCGFQGINAGVIHEVKRRRAGAGRQASASASDRRSTPRTATETADAALCHA